ALWRPRPLPGATDALRQAVSVDRITQFEDMEVRDHDYTTRLLEIYRRHSTDIVRFQQVWDTQGDRAHPWWDARPGRRLEVPDAAAHPAGHAQGRNDHVAGRAKGRLLRDLDEAD